MNFYQLNKLSSAKPKKKEFDVKEYLDRISNISNYVDLYLINEPIRLMDSCIELEKASDINTLDMNLSLVSQIEEYL